MTQLQSLHTRSFLSTHPLPTNRSQNTSTNPASTASSPPKEGLVSHVNAGKLFCVFLSLCWSSVCLAGHAAMVVDKGAANWRVALRGASVRVKPVLEKSVHDRVVRFSVRAYKVMNKRWGKITMLLTFLAPSFRSN